MFSITIILGIISLVVVFLLCISYPIRSKYLTKKLGKCLIPLTKQTNFSFFFFPVLCFCPLLIIVQYFRQFSLYIHIILDITAIIGVFIVMNERLYVMHNGLYKDYLVIDARLIKISDIMALPTLEYENDEEYIISKQQAQYEKDALELAERSLKIVSKKSGEIYVGFANKEEREVCVTELKKMI